MRIDAIKLLHIFCQLILLVTFTFPQHENLEGYRQYLYGVVGFFVIEDHVLNTGNGLVTRSYLDEVWEMASGKVCSV